MITIAPYNSKSPSIYPGIYQPPKGNKSKLMNDKEMKPLAPPVNIFEQPGHYRIEMAAPDFERNNFFIRTYQGSLLITARNRNSMVKQDVGLPTDADTDFGTAEYKNGMLYIYLYRGSCPGQNRHSQIIVY